MAVLDTNTTVERQPVDWTTLRVPSPIGWIRPIKTAEVADLTSQLGLMLRTGTPLLESLEALREQTENVHVYEMLEAVANEVRGGATLASALAAHPRVFDRFYVSAIEAGETSGRLVDVFSRIERYLRKKLEIRNSLIASFTYPAIIGCIAMGAVIFVITFVLPKFTRIFEKAGAALPAPTRLLLGFAHVFSNYWYVLLALAIGIPLAAYALLRLERVRRFLDTLLLFLPFTGVYVSLSQSSVMLRTLGTLLESGVPLVHSLEVTRKACKNHHFVEFIDGVNKEVSRGEPFSATFRQNPYISPTVKTMISTGDRSGSLPEIMTVVSDHLDEELDRKLKKMSTILEPAMIVATGFVVGFIVISILMPLFRLSGVAAGGV